MWTNIQLVSHDTPDSYNPVVDVDDIDATVNVAYGFGASPLAVRTLLLNLILLFT